MIRRIIPLLFLAAIFCLVLDDIVSFVHVKAYGTSKSTTSNEKSITGKGTSNEKQTSSPLDCYIYRIHFSGGLGNRLWQMFGTLGIAKNHSCHLTVYQPNIEMMADVFDMETFSSFFFFSFFNQSSKHNPPKGTRLFYARNFRLFKPLVLASAPAHVEVKGYLQNYLFLAPTSDQFGIQVRRSLSFLPNIVTEANSILRNMSRCSNTSEKVVKRFVGLHYRRFPDRHKIEPPPLANLTLQQMQTILDECDADGMSVVKCADGTTLSTCCALVLSNDPIWAKEHLNNLSCVRFVENEFLEEPFKRSNGERQNGWATDYGRDMCILTMVHTLVITTGTFGYWSALLHGKDTKGIGRVYAYKHSIATMNGQNLKTWTLWG